MNRVLAETKWHRKEAARRLKISYKALLNKLKRWEAEEGAPGAGTATPRRGRAVPKSPSGVIVPFDPEAAAVGAGAAMRAFAKP